jgi:predicted nucleic acid-binding protein
MQLVIDTNRIIAGLLRASSARSILFNPAFQFYAPDYILTEIRKHQEYLMAKSHVSREEFDLILSILFSRVILVSFEEFAVAYPRACSLMQGIDENDAPFLSVGIALSLDGIWTEDRHFLRQQILRVYSNLDLEERE